MKIKVIYRPFPKKIHGSVEGLTQKQNDHFLILIDDGNSAEIQDFALRHELAHIALNHFDKTLPIDEVISNGCNFGDEWEQREKEADSLAGLMTAEELREICSRRG